MKQLHPRSLKLAECLDTADSGAATAGLKQLVPEFQSVADGHAEAADARALQSFVAREVLGNG